MGRKASIGLGNQPLIREPAVLPLVARVVGDPPLPGDQSIPGEVASPGEGAQPGQHLAYMDAAELGHIPVAAVAAGRDRGQGGVEDPAQLLPGH